ncbi:hypothetical protein CONPUDRAFT_158829 [Coniophora puteana RWD-64-598 SS2]|uniref:Uncharacterized protein n=1 Tax=Coniophora puteana (strain RWD-64-598) TaxID=741705 RepID=A0A5M3MB73_CONPW|nr:uncharacterized protein CONPUDRAFT_158829 [Coniophora puteana RWD-64-598 SS2]EIW76060.1 hypothetical protein CONPUDRAFT_158829 [Coniophora puteana RWD-64-598 SS2]
MSPRLLAPNQVPAYAHLGSMQPSRQTPPTVASVTYCRPLQTLSGIQEPDLVPGSNGDIRALDFGATSFLPPAFFAVVMKTPTDKFTREIANNVVYPMSSNVPLLLSVSGFQVQFGRRRIEWAATPNLRWRVNLNGLLSSAA